jgi:hypothetical protein
VRLQGLENLLLAGTTCSLGATVSVRNDMIRSDYILRMIEEFIQALARINALKRGQLWQEADGAIDAEFKRLVGAGAQVVSQMSETELLAKIIQGEPTQVIHYKARLLATLLSQAGEAATAQNRLEEGRACYLKGLNLLLETMASSETSDSPDFVPTVAAFVIALQDAALPLSTQARLIQHYERVGSFGKAEDALFAMLEVGPNEPKFLDFGIAFYQRLACQSNSNLSAGNLSRAEVHAGLADLERRRRALVPS